MDTSCKRAVGCTCQECTRHILNLKREEEARNKKSKTPLNPKNQETNCLRRRDCRCQLCLNHLHSLIDRTDIHKNELKNTVVQKKPWRSPRSQNTSPKRLTPSVYKKPKSFIHSSQETCEKNDPDDLNDAVRHTLDVGNSDSATMQESQANIYKDYEDACWNRLQQLPHLHPHPVVRRIIAQEGEPPELPPSRLPVSRHHTRTAVCVPEPPHSPLSPNTPSTPPWNQPGSNVNNNLRHKFVVQEQKLAARRVVSELTPSTGRSSISRLRSPYILPWSPRREASSTTTTTTTTILRLPSALPRLRSG